MSDDESLPLAVANEQDDADVQAAGSPASEEENVISTPTAAGNDSKKRKAKRKSDGYTYKARKRSKNAKKKTEKEEEYEVEMIVDHKIENGEEYYLVKWKGWGEEYDEWLPKDNLHCPDLVAEFFKNNPYKNANPLVSPGTKQKNDEEALELQTYMESIMKPTNEDIELAIQLVCSGSEKPKVNGMKSVMSSDEIEKFAFTVFKKRQKLQQLERSLMMQLLTRDFRQRRAQQVKRLKEWEDEINRATQGTPSVKIENNVDLDEPPVGFTYMTHCKAGDGVVIPDDPVIGCECTDCIDCRKTCCGPMSGTQSAYTKAGRLKVPVGTPIYECNSRCLCGPECPNRVVQRGSKLKLCIFRTCNGRGWGVKTMQTIRKNTFVIEYVGEIITNEEAEKRGLTYDSEGRTYLFDLDFNDIDCVYSVDAAHHGNVAHFINHSCDPNLAVYAMWANCLDPNMPRLALFAQRDISAGEELTFDYASSKTDNASSSKSTGAESEVKVKNECRCGAAACRKIMFSLPGNQVIAGLSTKVVEEMQLAIK